MRTTPVVRSRIGPSMGATSFKAYMQITRDELRAAIDEAHRRGLKVTGHLCSVTYAEAADLGIDDLEHGFMASTDFVSGQAARRVPRSGDRAEDDCRARRTRASRSRRSFATSGRQARGADVDADRLRDVHARSAHAAGPRRFSCRSSKSSSSRRTSGSSRTRNRCTPRSFRRAWRSSARSRARAGC